MSSVCMNFINVHVKHFIVLFLPAAIIHLRVNITRVYVQSIGERTQLLCLENRHNSEIHLPCILVQTAMFNIQLAKLAVARLSS